MTPHRKKKTEKVIKIQNKKTFTFHLHNILIITKEKKNKVKIKVHTFLHT